MIKRFLMAALLAVSTSASAQIPEVPQGQFSMGVYALQWRPGRHCQPPRAAQELLSGGSVALEIEVGRWERCVRTQADNDARYAAKVVLDARDEALARGYDQMTRELEAVRR